MPHSNILVVVVDGLRASALGSYGNTSFPTRALDRFAAESLLFDWCYAPASDLQEIYRALWQSIHPARAPDDREIRPSLPHVFAGLDYQVTLVTDEPHIASLGDIGSFHDCVQVDNCPDATATAARAADISQTELARLFVAASDVIGRYSKTNNNSTAMPQLLWIHSRGMYGLWDAPLELQASLRDDDDPLPVESIAPPDFTMLPDGDPDAVFRYACAYAAQAIVLDDCWSKLINTVESSTHNCPWVVMLIGARGYPLGEHRRVGGIDSRLYTEQLHVPWLIRFPDQRGRLARHGSLASHLDVLPTLLDWLNGDVNPALGTFDGQSVLRLANSPDIGEREALLSSNASAYSIRLPNWCLREDTSTLEMALDERKQSYDQATSLAKLFVRPDDRWEANDISKLCPEVVQELQSAARDALGRMTGGERLPRTLLPHEADAAQA